MTTLKTNLGTTRESARQLRFEPKGSIDATNVQEAIAGIVAGPAAQPLDAELTALAGLTSAANKLPYFTGAGAAALTDFSAFGRSLVDDSSAAAALTTLGVSAFIQTLIDDADAATARATLGLIIGTNVQAQDAELAALAGLASAADTVPYFTGSGAAALTPLTAAARSVLDDTTTAAMLTTLGAVPVTRTVSTATGLSGGGDLSTNRTINYDLPSLTLETSLDTSNDLVLIYDASAGAYKKTNVGSIASVWGLSGSNVFYTAGNVGIGTANPAQLFAVGTTNTIADFNENATQKRAVIAYSSTNTSPAGDIGFVIRNENSTAGNTTGLSFSTINGDATINHINAAITVLNGVRSPGNIYPSGTMVFLTAPGSAGAQDAIERMRITSGGNVGIGVSAPLAKVDVSGGGQRIQGIDNPATGSGIEFGYDGAQGIIQAYSNRTALTPAPVTFYTSAPYKFNGDVYTKTGRPWADVMAWGAAGNGVADDTAEIQAACDYVYSTYGGAPVIMPAGTYLISAAIELKGGTTLSGAGQHATFLTAATDITLVRFVGGIANSGYASLRDMAVYGYQNAAAVNNAIVITENMPVILRDLKVFGGNFALENNGIDSIIENVYLNGWGTNGGGIKSTGANWYIRVKSDSGPQAVRYGFYQGESFSGASSAENHFTQSDFSGNHVFSIFIDDNATGAAMTDFDGCVASGPIAVNSAKITRMSGMFGAAAVAVHNTNGGHFIASDCFWGSAVSITGGSANLHLSPTNVNLS
jgi:hypothetical protein